MLETNVDIVDGREHIGIDDLRLPPATIPRSGDAITWYFNAARQHGWLSGHTPGARPFVRRDNGYTFPVASFDQIRWKDQEQRVGPAWQRLDTTALIVRPTKAEFTEFGRLLSQAIPPGPTYLELIEEIHHRGFEIFVVGGTVRDVLSGNATNDVDLVTTMPLERAAPLLQSMYSGEPVIESTKGYVRLGGEPGSGDPFIDLRAFVSADPGTDQVVFAGDFSDDVRHRDFACNAVYFDPMNNALIDPTGGGIADAANMALEVVCDPERPKYHRAQIVVRFVKFSIRGFVASSTALSLLQESFIPVLSAMPRSDLISYVHRQVIGKTPEIERPALRNSFEQVVREACGTDVWRGVFVPIIDQLLNESVP